MSRVTLPAGGSFCAGKRNQNPLRAFPPKDLPGVRGCPCVKLVFGPLPFLWLLSLPPHQATLGSWPYHQVVSTSGPPLEERRFRRREPGCPSLGTAAHQGEALAIEGQPHREADTFGRIPTPSMCPHGLRAEKRRTQIHPVPQGGFHKAGEGPAFGDSFVYFSSLRNRPPAERPWFALPSLPYLCIIKC